MNTRAPSPSINLKGLSVPPAPPSSPRERISRSAPPAPPGPASPTKRTPRPILVLNPGSLRRPQRVSRFTHRPPLLPTPPTRVSACNRTKSLSPSEELDLLGEDDPQRSEWVQRRARLHRKRVSPEGNESSGEPNPKQATPRHSGVQQVLRGELGQLGGKRVHFENDTPTLRVLFCEEQLPERCPSPIPMASPVQIVSWGDPKTQWAEGTVGKWRVAFS